MQERFKGTVVWFNQTKGFGFIGRAQNDPENFPKIEGDVFVHYSAIQAAGYRKLDQGDGVSFSVEQGKKDKIQATNVVLETPNEGNR